MSKLPNYCKIVFFIFRSVGEGEGWFEGDSTWLIHCKKPDSHQTVLLNSFKFCPPVVFIWLWLFFSCLRWRSFGWRGGGGSERGERFRYYIFFSSHRFPFFYYHKINIHVGISTFEQLFSLCFLKYESFSNCQQLYYRNIGYFGEICTCENLTFHLNTILVIIILLSNKHPCLWPEKKTQKTKKQEKTNVNKISQFIMNKLRDFYPQF